jgi:hypothetical protein
MRARVFQAVIGTALLAVLCAPAAQAAEPPPSNSPSIGGGPYIGDTGPSGTTSAGTPSAGTK